MSVPSPGAAGVAEPSSASHALRMVLTGLNWLACDDVASVPASVQADCLRGLEQAASMHAAARAKVLAGFSAQRGFRGRRSGVRADVADLADPHVGCRGAGRGGLDAAARRSPGGR